MEFRQHKRDYYIHKLGYSQVNEETLREQAEGYVRYIRDPYLQVHPPPGNAKRTMHLLRLAPVTNEF